MFLIENGEINFYDWQACFRADLELFGYKELL